MAIIRSHNIDSPYVLVAISVFSSRKYRSINKIGKSLNHDFTFSAPRMNRLRPYLPLRSINGTVATFVDRFYRAP